MKVFDSIDFASHEQIVFAGDPSTGILKAIIAASIRRRWDPQ